MDVTAKTREGKTIYQNSIIYMTQATNSRDSKMVYGAQYKVGYIRDTSLQPFMPRKEKIEISLPEGVRTVDVEVALTYQPMPGRVIPITKITKTVSLD